MIDTIKTEDSEDLGVVAEFVPLPSKGAFYKGPFKGMKMLKVRELSWEDEDILTTKSYYENGTLFSEILKNTIIDESGFSSKDLTNVDKDAILWWLRIRAFGKIYKEPHVCSNPECRHKKIISWDLTSFSMPNYPTDCEVEIMEKGYRTIKLPVSGLEVQLVAPSIGKELDTYKRLLLKKEKMKTTREFNTTGKLLVVIHSAKDAEGNIYKTPEEIHKWLLTANNGGRIPIVDSREIQKKAKEIDLAVETVQFVECPECKNMEEVEMSTSIFFFYPDYMDKLA